MPIPVHWLCVNTHFCYVILSLCNYASLFLHTPLAKKIKIELSYTFSSVEEFLDFITPSLHGCVNPDAITVERLHNGSEEFTFNWIRATIILRK